MIIPQYWAEGRKQHRQQGKQVTVRRFGWSDIGQQDAQTNADQRAEEALQRLLSGEKLARREPKIPYNGADGVPIREEILDRRGETIITRNSYGASCLNTPNVFFADVDFDKRSLHYSISVLSGLILILGVFVATYHHATLPGVGFILLGMFFPRIGRRIQDSVTKLKGGEQKIAVDRIKTFIASNPMWNLRIYRTPAGLRVLATHQLFDPEDPSVASCFKALGTDPIYMQMCLRQICFRARVSPKPWRIGIGDHMRPRPGTWPINEERLPIRNAWLARYQTAAVAFASCKFIESLGSGVNHPDVLPIVEWHDELSRATTDLPIA
ncbi:MAG TPA: hypothetical protein VF258_05595 [Luteolibacter sp.]